MLVQRSTYNCFCKITLAHAEHEWFKNNGDQSPTLTEDGKHGVHENLQNEFKYDIVKIGEKEKPNHEQLLSELDRLLLEKDEQGNTKPFTFEVRFILIYLKRVIGYLKRKDSLLCFETF